MERSLFCRRYRADFCGGLSAPGRKNKWLFLSASGLYPGAKTVTQRRFRPEGSRVTGGSFDLPSPMENISVFSRG